MKKYKTLLVLSIIILITGCGTKDSTTGNNTAGEIPKETTTVSNDITDDIETPDATTEINDTKESPDFSDINKISAFCMETEYYTENQEIINEFITQLNTGINYEENQSEEGSAPKIDTFILYNGDEKRYEISFDQINNIIINGQHYTYKDIEYIKTYSDIFKENPVNINDMKEV